MSDVTFDSGRVLSDAIASLSPDEVINLGCALCSAVESGKARGIWPQNISLSDSGIAFAADGAVEIADMTPEQLEYIAPEHFWGGEITPAGQAYSIGLVMYTALNGGLLPFFPEDGQRSPEVRADCLQRRMKGLDLPYPRFACRELGDVVLKALSFKSEMRYANVGELKAALEALPESAAIPAVAPVLPLTDDEKNNLKNYKVDKSFEKVEPAKQPKKSRRERKADKPEDERREMERFRKEPKSPLRWLAPVIIVAAVAVSVFMLLRGCVDTGGRQQVLHTLPPISNTVLPVIPSGTVPEHTAPPAVATPAPTPTPTPTEPPAPTYEIYVEDVTWDEAAEKCEQLGGTLAAPRSQDEFDHMIDLAEENGAHFIWIGASRGEDGQFHCVDGTNMIYAHWCAGEPSGEGSGGNPENYVIAWLLNGEWSYNDTINDPVAVLPRTYSGKICYICRFDG